jgi:RNA polymerase sigma-70 factor (ECF subfamily)
MKLQVVRGGRSNGVRHGSHERDHDLAEALRRREPFAAERLIGQYGERAYRLAARITGSAPDAQEVVQDAFWTVIRKIDTFRGESALGSWLYRIVANAAYQKLRKGRRHRHDVPLDEVLPAFDDAGRHVRFVDDWSSSVDDPAVRTEVRAALTAAIAELPASYRTVLVLRDVEGRSNLEIATTLGLHLSVVKTRVHRARLCLRKRLGDCFDTFTASAAACAS